MTFSLVGGYLFIFFARVIDVSLATLRTLMIVRGRRLQAACIGFFEVSVYIVALNKVVKNLDNPLNLLMYALGFATGNFVGSFVEEKIAMGNISAQVIPKNKCSELLETLRSQGFGVTVIEGLGLKGPRKILNISLKRRDLPRLLDCIEKIDPEAFVTVTDARATRGGYFRRTQKAK